jgi:dihydropyrimidine dehydrogenase (NAD+) subunit PreT
MTNSPLTPGIVPARLGPDALRTNFADLHAPFDPHEALVAADRCYFCHDAPCITACPTTIDIPLFIRQIATGTPEAAAKTILDQNILGGMCARVCPTETLCEQACVREAAEGKPVEIGRLQRYATDRLMATGQHPFARAPSTGKRVAVVGAGPAGLACAHRLAMHGHGVDLFDARPKGGGLNEYGIAHYKATDGFAAAELDWLMQIGGIRLHTDRALGPDLTLAALQSDYDAAFLGVGLAGVNALGAEGATRAGVRDAVDFIADLRQAGDLSQLPVGRRVVVIGGGMTAIDVAVQSKLLGAEDVTILYRRGPGQMKASKYEQHLAQTKGVRIKHWVMPKRVIAENGKAVGLTCEYTREAGGRLAGTGETFDIPADMIFKAIGQSYVDVTGGKLALEGGRITVDSLKRTSVPGIWAGGDCVAGGQDLTVASVDDGRRAAESIHQFLSA